MIFRLISAPPPRLGADLPVCPLQATRGVAQAPRAITAAATVRPPGPALPPVCPPPLFLSPPPPHKMPPMRTLLPLIFTALALPAPARPRLLAQSPATRAASQALARPTTEQAAWQDWEI